MSCRKRLWRVASLLLLGLTGLLLSVPGGCSRPAETYDSLLTKRIDCYNRMGDLLATVNSEAKAKEVHAELAKLVAEAEELWNRQDEMNWPKGTESQRLGATYNAKLDEAFKKLKLMYVRVKASAVPGLRDLEPHLDNLVRRGT